MHTFFQGPRPECTIFLRDIDLCAHIVFGLFMSVHIFFMPVIQIVSRVHTFSDFSAAQLLQNSGSGFRVPAPGGCAGRGGGKDSFPVNAKGAGPLPRATAAISTTAAAATAAATAAVEVVAGGGKLDEGSIVARAALRGRGLAFGGAAP